MPEGNGPDWASAAETWGDMVKRHNAELRDLLEWRMELRGAFGLVRLAIGSSILSAVVTMLALWKVMSE